MYAIDTVAYLVVAKFAKIRVRVRQRLDDFDDGCELVTQLPSSILFQFGDGRLRQVVRFDVRLNFEYLSRVVLVDASRVGFFQ